MKSMIYLNRRSFKNKSLQGLGIITRSFLVILALLMFLGEFAQALEFKDLQFSYETSDGGFKLSCDYSQNEKLFNDFDVICGKGSATVKEYRVHVLLREHLQKQNDKKTFEIIYSVHDLNKGLILNSMNQRLGFDIESQFKEIAMGLALENDSAFLTLTSKVSSQ